MKAFPVVIVSLICGQLVVVSGQPHPQQNLTLTVDKVSVNAPNMGTPTFLNRLNVQVNSAWTKFKCHLYLKATVPVSKMLNVQIPASLEIPNITNCGQVNSLVVRQLNDVTLATTTVDQRQVTSTELTSTESTTTESTTVATGPSSTTGEAQANTSASESASASSTDASTTIVSTTNASESTTTQDSSTSGAAVQQSTTVATSDTLTTTEQKPPEQVVGTAR